VNHFCTYCDQGYAARMLCLYASLKAQGEPFRLYVLCFDAETEAVVVGTGEPSLIPVPLRELLIADPAYAAVQTSRNRVEFFFTSTPVLVLHCLRVMPEVTRITYLDADLFFFGPASAVFAEQGEASVGIVPHRFVHMTADYLQHGIYNVGWVSFQRDAEGLACLEWWRERCIEWCYDRVEDGRYADQGYLNKFPQKFSRVRSLEHPGINAAPWNIEPDQITQVGGKPWFKGRPILFYHYQGIREVLPNWFDLGLRHYRVTVTRGVREWLYRPYVRELVKVQGQLKKKYGIIPSLGYKRLPEGDSWGLRWQRFQIQRVLPVFRMLRGRLIHCSETERSCG